MTTEYIKAKELARRLNVDPRTIRRITDDGHLPFAQLGKTRRYDWVLIEKMIKRNYPVEELEKEKQETCKNPID